MVKVTIPRTEYKKLTEKAQRYEYLRQIISEDLFASPPTRNTKEIVESFRKTKKYNQKFLDSLEEGLKHSSFFQG